MALCKRILGQAGQKIKATPSLETTKRSFVRLPTHQLIEEETLPHYNAERFCPVHIGDVLHGRYKVAGKLGYGAHSTSWLCRDLRSDHYGVIKVSTTLRDLRFAVDSEIKIYQHLVTLDSSHPGQSLIRELYDSFELHSLVGKHRCLVLQPMHMTLLEMMKLSPRPFGLPLLKMTLKRLLQALDLLHTEANVVHTDLKTDNIMLSLEDDKMLADFEDRELSEASPRKEIDEIRTIYQSRSFRRPFSGKRFGLPILCDLGEARIGKTHQSSPFVQPQIYRAPEIIFEMPWGTAVDIWNLGALIWDLFQGYHLFHDIFDSNGNYEPFKHLAIMVALIGPPPVQFHAA